MKFDENISFEQLAEIVKIVASYQQARHAPNSQLNLTARWLMRERNVLSLLNGQVWHWRSSQRNGSETEIRFPLHLR